MKPGEFIITFDARFYNPGDIITTSEGTELEITKVYTLKWWQRLLKWLGFKVYEVWDVKVKTK